MKLSFIVPIYNEAKTLSKILDKVLELKLPNNFEKEVILCNDCSTDNTQEVIDWYTKKYNYFKSLENPKNIGKSQTVKAGIIESTGDYIVIQDADLEYNPDDIILILENVLRNKCDVGYGNRFGKDNGMIYVQNFFGNIILSSFSSIFTSYRLRVLIPDMEVCYKLIKGDIVREIAPTIQSKSNFGFEPEITAKLSRYRLNGKNLKFIVLPISYYPRTIAEGKKMKAFRDGFKALWEIFYFNLF
jgi:glycosyltransferase involved in cell wall biosynthesis